MQRGAYQYFSTGSTLTVARLDPSVASSGVSSIQLTVTDGDGVEVARASSSPPTFPAEHVAGELARRIVELYSAIEDSEGRSSTVLRGILDDLEKESNGWSGT